jgi:hypothetical protein
MAGRANWPTLTAMEQRTITIRLEVQVEGDEVRGHASSGDDAGRPFAGWLGLIGAIDALLGETLPSGEAPAR